MRGIRILQLILSVLVLFSCDDKKGTGPKSDDEIRYKYFSLEKNGWKSRSHTNTINDINFTATEVPLQYYIVKDVGTQNLLAADSIYNANKRERIIEFEFLHTEEKKLLDEKITHRNYTESIEYISFGIQHDFYAVTHKNDTIKCSGIMYERAYNVAPHERVLLFFSGIDPAEDIQLVYTDHLFGNGTLKFRFKEKITPFLL